MQLRKFLALSLIVAQLAPTAGFAEVNLQKLKLSPELEAAFDSIPHDIAGFDAGLCNAFPGENVLAKGSESGDDVELVNCDQYRKKDKELATQVRSIQAAEDCPNGKCDGTKPIDADKKFNDILTAANKVSCDKKEATDKAWDCGKGVACNIGRSVLSIAKGPLAAAHYANKAIGGTGESLVSKLEKWQNSSECLNAQRVNCATDAVAAALFLPIMLGKGIMAIGSAAKNWASEKVSSGWNYVTGKSSGKPATASPLP
jgi:hypothetical protein